MILTVTRGARADIEGRPEPTSKGDQTSLLSGCFHSIFYFFFIYLKGRERETDRDRDRVPIYSFIP